jgi:hypothetical protein
MWLLLLACSTPAPESPEPAQSVDALLLAGEADAGVQAARAELERVKGAQDPVAVARANRVLASALLAAGEHESAVQHASDAVRGFHGVGDDGLADALLLLGQIQGAAGRPVDIPDVQVDAGVLREAVVTRLSTGSTDHLVDALAAVVAHHPSEAMHGILAGLAWQDGEAEVARSSARWLQANGSPQAHLEGGLLLARIDEQLGDLAAAEATLTQTCSAVPDPHSARCQRELGLFLAAMPERTDDARTALRLAGRSDDPDISGRALAALGVLESHEGSEDAARPVLEDALARLPAGHPERSFVQRHLGALGTGQCGCEAPDVPLEQRVFTAMDAELPGLVKDVTFDADGALQVTLSREATAEEQARLQAIQEAVLSP